MNARDNPYHPEHAEVDDGAAFLAILSMPLDGSQPAPSTRPVVVQLQAALYAKRIANCVARSALRGITLHQLEANDGGLLLIATQWHLTKSFSSLDEAESWLDRIGA